MLEAAASPRPPAAGSGGGQPPRGPLLKDPRGCWVEDGHGPWDVGRTGKDRGTRDTADWVKQAGHRGGRHSGWSGHWEGKLARPERRLIRKGPEVGLDAFGVGEELQTPSCP